MANNKAVEIDQVKEKLIKLLQHDNCPLFMVFGEIEGLADYLIANGVTVQEWIPVTERLPEIFEPVLVKYLNYHDGSANPAYVDVAVLLDKNVWAWWEGDVGDCGVEVECTLTHWMPLPQPPKGE